VPRAKQISTMRGPTFRRDSIEVILNRFET